MRRREPLRLSYDFEKHRMSWATGPDGVLIAVRPIVNLEIDAAGATVSWWDPLHQRAFVVQEVLRDEADDLEFQDDLGRRFRLRPMTLEVYRRAVLPAIPGGRDFETGDELERFFARTVWGLP